MSKQILLIWLYFSALPLFGQSLIDIKYYSVQDGLSQKNIQNFIQDDNGYIFYECKYKNSRVTQDVVDQEIEQVKNVNMTCYKYGLFSKSGFDLKDDYG